MSLPDSPFSADEIERICRNWTTDQDICHDLAMPLKLEWPCDRDCKDVFGESMAIAKTRDLPDQYARAAREYIATIVAKYPFQLRQEMARPMWHRFLDVWNDTGKRHLAMRAI